ncbi:MAG: hypothetical protein RJA44_2747 [Pseudomonadota bacterium]|jgi:hypothetical protein
MANIQAVHSVGHSIVTYLNNTYPAQSGGATMPSCKFTLLSSGELAGPQDDSTRITLYLFRITVNEHCRSQRPERMSSGQQSPLGLDLHFLLTAWAGNARDEQLPLAWAMRQLYLHPILDAASLSPEAGWDSEEVIHIIPSELPTEDLMRVWDALDPPYHLSASYIARLVRLDPDVFESERPVVARRLSYGRPEAEGHR